MAASLALECFVQLFAAEVVPYGLACVVAVCGPVSNLILHGCYRPCHVACTRNAAPQPARCSTANRVAYLAVALTWASLLCQLSGIPQSSTPILSYTAVHPLSLNRSTVSYAGSGDLYVTVVDTDPATGASSRLTWNQNALQLPPTPWAVSRSVSSALSSAAMSRLLDLCFAAGISLLMLLRLGLELHKGAVFPCEEPACMALVAAIHSTLAALPPFFFSRARSWLLPYLAPLQLSDVQWGETRLQLATAGLVLSCVSWAVFAVSCTQARGGHFSDFTMMAQMDRDDDTEGGGASWAGPAAVELEDPSAQQPP